MPSSDFGSSGGLSSGTADRLRAVRLVANNPGPFTLQGTNTWIVGREPSAVIDPGPDDEQHIAAVARAAGQAATILLTHDHSDHVGGARRLSLLLALPVRGWRSGSRRHRLLANERIRLGGGALRVIYAPGHARDHVVFFDEAGGGLFTGDAVLGRGSTSIEPPDGDLIAYLESLRAMQALAPTTLFPGHGPTVRAAGRRLDAYLQHRLDRDREILAILTNGPASATTLAARIHSRVDPDLREAAEATVYAHLLKLRAERVVSSSGRGFEAVFRCRDQREGVRHDL